MQAVDINRCFPTKLEAFLKYLKGRFQAKARLRVPSPIFLTYSHGTVQYFRLYSTVGTW